MAGGLKLVISAAFRPLLEARLPGDLAIAWVDDADAVRHAIVDADAAWLDGAGIAAIDGIVGHASRLRWLSTLAAGVEFLDLDRLRTCGTMLTNGAGLNAAVVADYAVMGVLAAAKRFDEVVRRHDRQLWSGDAPGRVELAGSAALIVGFGAIGREIGTRLEAFGVTVTGATRSGRDGTLAADAWQARLGDVDWVILAAPATGATTAMIGAAELAAMKPSAWLVNVARGDLVDQPALVAALIERRIGGAFLDTVTPEPLPANDPLWSAPNCMITMHLSGRSQTGLAARAADLFLANLAAFRAGRPMRNVVDLGAGY